MSKSLGEGEKCSILLKYVHPLPAVQARFPNYISHDAILIFLPLDRMRPIAVVIVTLMCSFALPPSLMKISLLQDNMSPSLMQVISGFWDEIPVTPVTPPLTGLSKTQQHVDEGNITIYYSFFCLSSDHHEDISWVCNQGLFFENDNKLAPEYM